MMFADAIDGVKPEWGWQAVLFAFAIAGITAAWMQALNGRRAQKRDVTLMEEFATRKELSALAEKVETRFEDLRCELREDRTEILKAGEERAVKLHERCNAILQAVSEVRGEMHANRGRGSVDI
jgi:hypothetical protein